ncbi:unnamed protein product [Ixodes persulcatus]
MVDVPASSFEDGIDVVPSPTTAGPVVCAPTVPSVDAVLDSLLTLMVL